MSKEATLIFFGVRFAIQDHEILSVETRTHPVVQRGRAVGLELYWENFGQTNPEYLGFVGRRLGILGSENDFEMALDHRAFQSLANEVTEKLRAAGIAEVPKLYMMWMPAR